MSVMICPILLLMKVLLFFCGMHIYTVLNAFPWREAVEANQDDLRAAKSVGGSSGASVSFITAVQTLVSDNGILLFDVENALVIPKVC